MDKIKVGVVGVVRGGGFMWTINECFSDEIEVVAVCDINPDSIKQAKERGHLKDGVKTYNDFDEFLECDMDAVFLGSYFIDHAQQAIKAMEKGIAVYSETTAAPSLGECVDLVEAAERTNGRYMLAANCLYYPAVHVMKGIVESGEYGMLLGGNAEYNHGGYIPPLKDGQTDISHWRQTLPQGYYNMHSLGPLMYVTNSVPVKVYSKATYNPKAYEGNYDKQYMFVDSPSSAVITQMDNGAVFHTTGCINQVPANKWYRLSFSGGNVETLRYDETICDLLEANGLKKTMSTVRYNSHTSGIVPESERDFITEMKKYGGHVGADCFATYFFLKFAKGELTPFFDVYRSVALSAAGILSWYSALSGKEYDIPDFRKKEDRDKVRGDYRMPFAKKYSELTLPCKISEKDKFTDSMR